MIMGIAALVFIPVLASTMATFMWTIGQSLPCRGGSRRILVPSALLEGMLMSAVITTMLWSSRSHSVSSMSRLIFPCLIQSMRPSGQGI